MNFTVLVDQAAPSDLGGVCGQNQIDVQLGECLTDLGFGGVISQTIDGG